MTTEPKKVAARGTPRSPERTFTLGLLQVYAGRLGLAAFGFATSVITARTLGPGGRGELAILTAVPALLALALEFGQETTTSHLASRSAPDRARLHGNLALYAALSFVPAFILVALAFRFLLRIHGNTFLLAAAGAASVVATLYFYGASGMLLALGRLRIYNSARVLTTGGFFVAVVGLVAVDAGTPRRFFVAAVGSQLLVATILALSLRTLRGRPSRALAREQVRAGISVHASNLAQVMLYRADQLVLFAVVGAAAVGHYVVAVSVAEALWYLPTAAGALSVPYLSAPGPLAEKRRSLVHALRISLWMAVIGAGLVALAAPFALPLVFGPAFDHSIVPLEFLLPGITAASVAGTSIAALLAARRFRRMLVVTFAALGVNGVLMGLLIPGLDAAGAALASTGAYVLLGAAALRAATGVWEVPWQECLRPFGMGMARASPG
jgi:O-antigen/teichoic acid export membrane protein